MGKSAFRRGRIGAALAGFTAAAVLTLGGIIGTAHAKDELPPPAVGVLAVDDAVRLSLAKNYDLHSVEEAIRIAAGQRDQALQGYIPSLSARVDYTRSFDNNVIFSGGVVVPVNPNNYRTNFTLSQTILDWQAIKNIQSANRNKEASEYDYRSARNDLVLATKQQYYALVRAQLLETVADSALVLSQQELRRVQSLFELGMVAKGDVLKAEVRVSESQLDKIRNGGNAVLERARLAAMIGQSPTDDLHADTQNVGRDPVPVDSAAVFQEAVANRPDLHAIQQSWQAAEAAVGAAQAGWYPTLRGALNFQRSDSTLRFTGDRSRAGQVSLDFPLFQTPWSTKGQVQESQARAEQARYAYEKKRLDVEVEVREAVQIARSANEGLLVAQSGLESAEEDLKLSQEKYNVGSGTILELIDAQVALQRSRSNLVQAVTEARVAEARLTRVRGTQF
jgi:outer membrane protein TolC